MLQRESKLPLLIGALVSVLAHVALAPVWGLGLARLDKPLEAVPPERDKPLPEPPAQEVEAGKAHASVTNLAWIAYDDYQELLARHALIEQPALQREAEPVPGAPMELDPTPPAPNSPPSPEPGEVGEPQPDAASMPVPVSPVGPVPLPEPVAGGDLPYAPDGPIPRDTELVLPELTDVTTPADEQIQPEATDRPGTPDAAARPTGAPRDDREAPPVTIIPGLHAFRPGRVLTLDGIEVNTVVAKPSIITLSSTIPNNARAILWFDRDGKVKLVDLVRSTGVQSWDDAVITALEQWTATGERFDQVQGDVAFAVEYILRPNR